MHDMEDCEDDWGSWTLRTIFGSLLKSHTLITPEEPPTAKYLDVEEKDIQVIASDSPVYFGNSNLFFHKIENDHTNSKKIKV